MTLKVESNAIGDWYRYWNLAMILKTAMSATLQMTKWFLASGHIYFARENENTGKC